jgi:hypothetical protein
VEQQDLVGAESLFDLDDRIRRQRFRQVGSFYLRADIASRRVKLASASNYRGSPGSGQISLIVRACGFGQIALSPYTAETQIDGNARGCRLGPGVPNRMKRFRRIHGS